jgi:phage shock protein C
MIRITGLHSLGALSFAFRRRPVLNLHRFVDYQCCAAISRLQHAVGIPNCRVAEVVALPNPLLRPACSALELEYFSVWHGLCLEGSIALPGSSKEMSAQENEVALPLRTHTILGVCEGIGEDFGFNPIFLRVPLAAMVIVNATWAFGAYFALGAIVLVSRLLFPDGKASTKVSVEQPATAANEQNEMAKAA